MIGDKIKLLRNKANLTQEELGNKIGVSASTIGMYEQGRRSPDGEKTICLATIFNVSTDYLLGRETAKNNLDIIPVDLSTFEKIPVYGQVSAGNGCLAINDIIDYELISPDSINSYDEYFFLKVKGDSMEPQICEGDLALIQKQSSVDSGSLAVVIVDDENGVIKKVNYGPDWIDLVSFNPYYPIRHFEGAEVQRLRVVGLVKEIKRKFN